MPPINGIEFATLLNQKTGKVYYNKDKKKVILFLFYCYDDGIG